MVCVVVLTIVLGIHEEDVHIGDIVLLLYAIAVKFVGELSRTEVELIVGHAVVVEILDNCGIIDVLGFVREF